MQQFCILVVTFIYHIMLRMNQLHRKWTAGYSVDQEVKILFVLSVTDWIWTIILYQSKVDLTWATWVWDNSKRSAEETRLCDISVVLRKTWFIHDHRLWCDTLGLWDQSGSTHILLVHTESNTWNPSCLDRDAFLLKKHQAEFLKQAWITWLSLPVSITFRAQLEHPAVE